MSHFKTQGRFNDVCECVDECERRGPAKDVSILNCAGKGGARVFLCAEHDRQLGFVGPLPTLMAAKG